METDKLNILHTFAQDVKASGADIAPAYDEYVKLAFALAADCGEAGRKYFHELCALSPKYDERHADNLYTSAVKASPTGICLNTAFYLAGKHDVDLKASKKLSQQGRQIGSIGSIGSDPLTHTRARVDKVDENTSGAAMPEEPLTEGADPYTRLPTLPQEYVWPSIIQRCLSFGETPEQRDALLLGTVATLGATLADTVQCLYGKRWYSPVMQVFVVAPSASGKGVMSWVRLLAEPLHDEVRRASEEKYRRYQAEKAQYDSLGKERSKAEAPVEPSQETFLIPGNNSSTGILENIISSGGRGIIFEVEADTISAAIGADYGHWSDTLRKVFDQERLSFNRRTGREYREVKKTYVAVVVTGTPAQVKPLIPSAENGLFSRQNFYYMARIQKWADQFTEAEVDAEAAFRAMGYEWLETLKGLKQRGTFILRLSAAQKRRFNAFFDRLYRRAGSMHNHEMNSSVVRLAISALRILMVVALLRAEEEGTARPAADIPADNVKDGIVQRWDLRPTEADFEAVLSLVEPLYLHATHILSFLTPQEVQSRGSASRDMLFASLPTPFSRQQLLAEAAKMGIPEGTALTWLKRFLAKGIVRNADGRGVYFKT